MFFRTAPARAILAVAAVLTCLSHNADAKARNVIIFVSDGSGFNTYLATSYYQYGTTGRQPYEAEGWVKLAATTYPLTLAAPKDAKIKQDKAIVYDPDKVWDGRLEAVVDRSAALPGTGPFKGYNFLKKTPTDSAAAATALATGIKTYNAAINFAKNNEDETVGLLGRSMVEIVHAMGKSAGVVTTVPISHATPAALGGSHNVTRSNYYNIANELLNTNRLDVVMGGGHPEYDVNGSPRIARKESDYDFVGGSFTWDELTSGRHPRKWTLVQSKAEFESLAHGPAPRKVLGVAPVAQTLQQQRRSRDWNGDGYVDARDVRVSPAYGDPLNVSVPTLATMTRGAINVLSQNKAGFFLMVEGGAIDWANHANQPGRMIEEQIGFNEAVAAAVEWVTLNSSWDETLIVVTSDHETGLLWGANSDRFAFEPVANRGAGRMPGLWHNTGGHSNSLVPLFARGNGSELLAKAIVGGDPVYGDYVENTSIFKAMAQAVGAPAKSLRQPRMLKPRSAPASQPARQEKSGTGENAPADD